MPPVDLAAQYYYGPITGVMPPSTVRVLKIAQVSPIAKVCETPPHFSVEGDVAPLFGYKHKGARCMPGINAKAAS